MTKVKICGITNPEDAKIAVDFGADFIGLIVEVPVQTPRKLTLGQAKKIIGMVNNSQIVIVIIPSSITEIENIVETLNPTYLQLHGNESPKLVSEIKENFKDLKLIKTFHMESKSTLDSVLNTINKYNNSIDVVLLDTKTDKIGGTGKTHDWNLSRKIRENIKMPIFLSGGLNSGNVKEAVNIVRPFAVDVASGVESEPGKKDPDKIKKFVNNSKCST